jgi:hypothetical protein
MSCGSRNDHPHIYTPIKAIRKKCLDCCCGSSREVEHCPVNDCSLYPYRLGKSPTRKGRQLSEEERKAASERLARARAIKRPDSDLDKR